MHGRTQDKLLGAMLARGFDDFVLKPGVTDVVPEDVNLGVELGPLRIACPLIAAAMEQTSSVRLCNALASAGGVAILPRWPMKKRLGAVRQVRAYCARLDCEDEPVVAVTVSEDEVDSVQGLVKAGATLIVLDSAYAHRPAIVEAAQRVRSELRLGAALMVGNIATGDAARDLASVGIDALKVGFGVGSICTTTEMTGVGMPQPTAIAEVADALVDSGVTVVAEGGMLTPGDIVKAFACGAHAVSLGNLFARSLEAGGKIARDSDGRSTRKYAANFYPSMAYTSNGSIVPGEGVEGLVPIEGSVRQIVDQSCVGARAGLAFCGAKDIAQIHRVAEFVHVLGYKRSRALDDVRKLKRKGSLASERREPATDQFLLFGEEDISDVGVAIIVWEDSTRQRMLIGRRRGKSYAVPGGHWSRGEPLSRAAYRETREETGIAITDIELASVHELYHKGRRKWVITIGFQGNKSGGDLLSVKRGSLTDLTWVTPEDALQLEPMFGTDKDFIRRTIAGQIYPFK